VTATSSEVRRLEPWFHNLHLPDGTQTCPEHTLGDFPNAKWRRLAPFLPEDLRGVTVLDIGCNAGFYTLELAKRGASVTALDTSEHYLKQARWAASLYGLSDRIEFQHRQVYSLARTARSWDIVLFLGVLYHLRYPQFGLDIVSRCVGRALVVQSLLAPGGEGKEVARSLELSEREPLASRDWPRLSFIEGSLAGDKSNWWAPNQACLAAMLRSSGMRILAQPFDECFLCEPDRSGETSAWTWNAEEYWAAAGASRGEDENGGRGT
jgi:tRNA (mo5U34)-methyltransferase